MKDEEIFAGMIDLSHIIDNQEEIGKGDYVMGFPVIKEPLNITGNFEYPVFGDFKKAYTATLTVKMDKDSIEQVESIIADNPTKITYDGVEIGIIKVNNDGTIDACIYEEYVELFKSLLDDGELGGMKFKEAIK